MMKKKFENLLCNSFQSIPLEDPKYAVAIIVSDNDEILLIERATREGDHWSGHMAFPGGKKESDDQNLETTARRETLEEVGLQLDILAGPLMDIPLRKRGLPVPGTLSSFVFWSSKKDLQLDANEVAGAYWIPFEHFENPKCIGEYILERNNMRVSLPCVLYKDKKIWGLTYHLLSRFFLLCGQTDGRNYSHLKPLFNR
jgi:8-oxo-dGTP pyrophosphatase MutT (NUDIX family)